MQQYHTLSFILSRNKYTLCFPQEEMITIDRLFSPGIYERKHVASTIKNNMYTLLNTTLTNHQNFRHFNYSINEQQLHLTIFRTTSTNDEIIKNYQEEEHHILNLLQLGSNVLQLYQGLDQGLIAILENGNKMTTDFFKKGMWFQQHYLHQTGSITDDQLAFWLEENDEFKDKEPPLQISYRPLLLN